MILEVIGTIMEVGSLVWLLDMRLLSVVYLDFMAFYSTYDVKLNVEFVSFWVKSAIFLLSMLFLVKEALLFSIYSEVWLIWTSSTFISMKTFRLFLVDSKFCFNYILSTPAVAFSFGDFLSADESTRLYNYSVLM